MSATPPPKTESNQRRSGTRLLAIGIAMIVVGAIVLVFVHGPTSTGIGVAVMALGSVPTVAGVALTGTSLVARRARQGKPFA
jgi:uncharacterized membrane protein HdeD (DUF308 family)